MPNIIARKKEI